MYRMNRMYRTLLATVALALSSVTASADTIYVPAGGDIIKAINQVSNGDGVPDRLMQPFREWNGGWKPEPETGAYSYSYDGESVSLSFTPVAIDWDSALGDSNGNFVRVSVGKLADIDGDGRRRSEIGNSGNRMECWQ